MALQTFPLYYNIDQQKLVDSGNSEIFTPQNSPVVFRDLEDIVFTMDFFRDNGTLATDVFELTDTWSFEADDDFDEASTSLIQSLDAEFNIGGDRSDLDVAGGKISWRVDTTSTNLETAIDTLGELSLTGEVKVTAAAATVPKARFQFKLIVKNKVHSTGTPGSPVSNFYTKAEVDALLAGKNDTVDFATVTTIDFTATATHDVTTVPTGKVMIVERVLDITKTITGAGTAAFWKPKTDAPTDLGSAIESDSNALNAIGRREITHETTIPAGEKVQIEITTGSTATTHTGQFIVIGRVKDA